EGRLAPAGVLDLDLEGATGSAPPEDHPDIVELLQYVERGRLYHADGRMRLVCLARIGRAPHPFLVALTGRPLSLLRAVHAPSGAGVPAGTEHLVRTPCLALPTAMSLERTPDVRLEAL
ncbi:MAG TPA: hypothetical protein VI248_14930, partial [Kineosporiaceae bacterium]